MIGNFYGNHWENFFCIQKYKIISLAFNIKFTSSQLPMYRYYSIFEKYVDLHMIAYWEIDFGMFSGVADQLQTNYAGDLRNILKCVFDMNCSDPVIVLDESPKKKFDRHPNFMARRTNRYGHRSISNRPRGKSGWWYFTMFSHMLFWIGIYNFVSNIKLDAETLGSKH